MVLLRAYGLGLLDWTGVPPGNSAWLLSDPAAARRSSCRGRRQGCRHGRAAHRAVTSGEEDQVTWFGLAGGDLLPEGPLLAGTGDVDAGGAVGHHRQAGAVEGVRAGAAPLLGLAGLGLGVGDDLARDSGGQRGAGGRL